MNKHAANDGDVLKHLLLAELVHLERSRLRTYVDTHAGLPWNDLSQTGYRFNRRRAGRRWWADDFMKAANAGSLGPQVKNAQYTKLLAKTFWINGHVAPQPLYPGSVGVVQAVAQNVHEWLLAEAQTSDRRALRRAAVGATVVPSLLSPSVKLVTKLRGAIGPQCMVFVDLFRLAANGWVVPDARHARRFIVYAARAGALVMAWYPLSRPDTPREIERRVWEPLGEAPLQPTYRLKVEVRWLPNSRSQAMSGAGVIIANATAGTGQQLSSIAEGLARNGWALTIQ